MQFSEGIDFYLQLVHNSLEFQVNTKNWLATE